MLSLTLRQLEYVVAIARHGGLTAAAGRIHISQPALSVALAQVEATLGQPLFIRRPGGKMFPTPFAHDWLALAEEVLTSAARISRPGGMTDHVLRLALFEDFGAGLLGPLLGAAPQDRITAELLGFDALALALRQGRVAAAVTWDLGLDSDIRRRIIGRMSPKVILPLGHQLTQLQSLRLADIHRQALVLTDQGQSLGHMRGLFARQGLVPQIAHKVASFEQMLSFAANGLGLGLSYLTPQTICSQDGAGFAIRPLIDAGTEPLVLAELDGLPQDPALQMLEALLDQVIPNSILADLQRVPKG